MKHAYSRTALDAYIVHGNHDQILLHHGHMRPPVADLLAT